MSQLPPIERFETSTGARIYRIPLEVFFNGFIGFVHVVLEAGPPTLVDTGSGYGQSNSHLLAGLNALKDDFGESITPKDIERIIVTHGHIDHFGGVAFAVEQTKAKVGIHELERRVLTNYEERVIMASKDLRVYLERAGIDESAREEIMGMYGFAKQHVRSVEVNFSLDDDMEFDGMRFVHAPGHCPGQVCIILGDTMLVADHVLSKTTPHQAPESITHYTGLGHYRDSLRKVSKIDGIRLALGGHEDPIYNLYDRIQEINASHERKLNRVLDIIRDHGQPITIREITQQMYPDKEGYEILLALEEAGAHIEYLYQHGNLSIANLAEVEKEDNPALKYVIA